MIKFQILGSNGGSAKNKGLTSFLINDHILIDAGNVVNSLTIEAQSKIDHIFVSHSHLDHIKDIPLLTDNFVEIPGKKVQVYGLPETIDSLKNNFFNNIIFPDFAMIPLNDPILHYNTVTNKQPISINGVTITPIEVNHTVPNVAYIIEKNSNQCVFISDTYSTSEIFNEINNRKNIKFIIIETSFANESEELAKISKHLTPNLMLKEINKINDTSIPIYIFHMKPKYSEKIVEEINSLNTDRHIEFLKDGMVFEI